MNRTPRFAGAYPQTPQTTHRTRYSSNGSTIDREGSKVHKPAPLVDESRANSDSPVIPFDIIDAPSQRLYVLTFYIGLLAWRVYDYWNLVAGEVEAAWLFMKWVAIDGVFLFGLPGLRIPWLQWAFSTTLVIFLIHAFFNAVLMFGMPFSLTAWFWSSIAVLYDREWSVSDRRVKPADIIQNASLILGKQIIHILPEGSAILNPEQYSFCLGPSTSFVELPISINQTNPISIELLRIDLDTNTNETVALSTREIKQLKKKADKLFPKHDRTSPRVLKYAVKKTGLYRLQKVIDESKLEVRRRLSDTLVVSCPRAVVRPPPPDKCQGELSDMMLEVRGTPPLKIKYSRKIQQDGKWDSYISSFQTIQPEDLVSPLLSQQTSRLLIDPRNVDVSWAREHEVRVPLNESLNVLGNWLYAIEEVHDACGNVVKYPTFADEDIEHIYQKSNPQNKMFKVHERPRIVLMGCDLQHPLRVASNAFARIPIFINKTGLLQPPEWPLKISYLMTPDSDDEPSRQLKPRITNITFKNIDDYHLIWRPGRYTLKDVSSQFCKGEIMEPDTCLLINPPEPDLTVHYEDIPDKCAGNTIGLMLDLDMIGTPPFKVQYNICHGNSITPKVAIIDKMRHQLELTPLEAGHYKYEFLEIEDSVYMSRELPNKIILEQDVKPPASAHFVNTAEVIKACIDEPVSVRVRLLGQGPWTLQYELVHGTKRTKHELTSSEEFVDIKTPTLSRGGEYSLSLSSVTDRTKCKKFLKDRVQIDVRHQRPQASFGKLEGKYSLLTLEDKKGQLPLRLTGESPWTLKFVNHGYPDQEFEAVMDNTNDYLQVEQQGTYELLDVQDKSCPGSIDPRANAFAVSWIPRPALQIRDNSVEEEGGMFVKRGVCQGDEDVLELKLIGSPPYHVGYKHSVIPNNRGVVSADKKQFTAGVGSTTIRMDTSIPGLHEYAFSELGDYLYDHDPAKHIPTIVQQRINSQPLARFAHPGKTYAYCKDVASNDETIPIVFSGTPPFFLEISIKHITRNKPEILSIPNIETNNYKFHVPHQYLEIGQSLITIRKVRDTLGCERKSEYDGSSVRVHVSDVPTISPLESRMDYCVGDRIAYTLSGSPPFNIFYTFQGANKKASSPTTTFRRIADRPGNFTITSVSDGISGCRSQTALTKIIHEMPSVRISQGRESIVDIHEGGDAELLFEFTGNPPFEFTYTRSTNAQKGKKSRILETKREVSNTFSKTVRASAEGTYEVVAIKDRYCSFSTMKDTKSQDKKMLQ